MSTPMLKRMSNTLFQTTLELLRAFEPPRPVRLLGVRVAGLTSAEVEPEQLALCV